MRTKRKAGIALVLGVFTIGVSPRDLRGEETFPNFSKGYCVQAEEELIPENAVVRVDGVFLDGESFPRVFPGDHQFFDDQNGEKRVYGGDWGGLMSLEKTEVRSDGSFVARYKNDMHGYEVDEMAVLCVADERN